MNEINGRDTGPRRRAMLTTAAAAATALLMANSTPARADDEKPQLMFVQIAEDLKVDAAAHTLRLVKVGQQTLFFSDRPVRIAGHVKMADYLLEWTAKAGPDNFATAPPNATVSVFEPGKADNTLAVVTLSNPRIDGADLIYSYKLVEGPLPSGGGAASVFIDWIGAGGGVGAGFHGAGVGRRGPGVYR